MRAGAFRRLISAGLCFTATLAVLAGCSSATKKHYLRHLSITLAPVPAASEALAAFDVGRDVESSPVIAAIEPRGPVAEVPR